MPGPIFFIGAFTTSWIAGFVVSGAPAGLGVRAVVLTAWLAGALPQATAVLLVVALRIATTTADLVTLLWGSDVLVRIRQSTAVRSVGNECVGTWRYRWSQVAK